MLAFNFSPFPQLSTDRLLLKQITSDDAPALFEMRSNPDVMKHIARPVAKTVDDALALIKLLTDGLLANDSITWGIFVKSNPARLMGTVGFWRIQKEHYRAEIGYMLHPSLQGKGVMKEVVEAVLRYGFGPMRLHSVEAHISPDNGASVKLVERCGFLREAYFKENYFFNGRFGDTLVYSFLTPVPADGGIVEAGA